MKTKLTPIYFSNSIFIIVQRFIGTLFQMHILFPCEIYNENIRIGQIKKIKWVATVFHVDLNIRTVKPLKI